MEIIDDLIYYYYRRAEEKTPRPPKGTFTQLIHLVGDELFFESFVQKA
jgi:hypothetical protein